MRFSGLSALVPNVFLFASALLLGVVCVCPSVPVPTSLSAVDVGVRLAVSLNLPFSYILRLLSSLCIREEVKHCCIGASGKSRSGLSQESYTKAVPSRRKAFRARKQGSVATPTAL